MRRLLLVTILLLLAAYLRFHTLGAMRDMLNFDEAWDAINAVSLINEPRLIAFFPDNGIRQSGWMYYLAGWIAAGGVEPFVLRVATVMVGMLTLAGVYAVARRVLGAQSAVWAVGALGVLFWHAHLSHIVLRAILFPLIGVLALAFLFRAERSNRLKWWAAGGVFTGLLLYTYFSAVLWLAFIGLMLGWWFVRLPALRRGVAVALGATVLIAIPMAFYLLDNFTAAASRPVGVAALTPATISQNALIWLNAWFGEGSTIPQLNLPGLPILDIPLGVLVIAGLLNLVIMRERLGWRLWLLGLAAVSLAPSLFSFEAPHPLRAIGLVVPIALVAGSGGVWIAAQLRRWPLAGLIVPLLLIAWAGFDTSRVMARWLRRPDVYVQMEKHVTEAAAFLESAPTDQGRVYVSPFPFDHPDVLINQSRLAPRLVSGFDSHECLVLPESKSTFVSLDMYDPAFQDRYTPLSDISVLHQDSVSPPHYRIYQVTPHQALVDGWSADGLGVFGDSIQIRLIGALPDPVKPGGQITAQLAFRALRPLETNFNVFSHLQGDPTPYEGGQIWGQADSVVCASHPMTVWSPDEIIIQSLTLTVSPDAPPGAYTLALGLYDLTTLARLPVSNPPEPDNYYAIASITIAAP
jgi:hypothetical protein